jgi:hypothetical protein
MEKLIKKNQDDMAKFKKSDNKHIVQLEKENERLDSHTTKWKDVHGKLKVTNGDLTAHTP